MVPLGDVAQVNPSSLRLGPQQQVNFVGMADLDAERARTDSDSIREYSSVSKGYTVFADGDILVAKITPCFENNKIGQAQLRRKIGVGSTEFHVLRPNERLHDRYLLHFLRQEHVRRQGEMRMTGSAGQRRIPASFLKSLPIPLPALDEQRRIAAILDHIGNLRTKRLETIKLLDSVVVSIFSDTFGDFSDPIGKWPTITLGDVISDGPQNGLYRPAKDYGTGTPIVRIDCFQNGLPIDVTRLKRVQISESDAKSYALASGDLLINRVNSRTHLGKATVVSEPTETTVYESNMMRFRVDGMRVQPEYVLAAFQTPLLKGQIQSAAKDAVNQSSINQKDVMGFKIPLPPMEQQIRYLQRRHHVQKLHRRTRRSVAALDELFASLQSRAFRGEP
ncbi:restriction endonuclease subunit S [Mycolicibacterium conceptionense]|uniref:restriction endonuclease subunit S n=1 Tax=Mycolicibacterium conceptionense TaxID=451644 RepID=UPI00096E7558|nr:restriction endonuclease subunit S [Mycolicibacterium conceptionense]OMB88076.1 hypothetical protein A5743_01095 [Mycolicibacterium conceptionense]